jgi:hypothetical protein
VSGYVLVSDVVDGVNTSVLVEDYPDFSRGPSVLVRQSVPDGRYIHVVWGIPAGHSAPAVVVTAYVPDPNRWSGDFLRRFG